MAAAAGCAATWPHVMYVLPRRGRGMWRRVDRWDDGCLSTRAWPPAVQLMRFLDLVCAGGGRSKWCVCASFTVTWCACGSWTWLTVCVCVCVCVCRESRVWNDQTNRRVFFPARVARAARFVNIVKSSICRVQATPNRVRPKLSTGVGVRLSVGEPLEAKRLPTRTGIMRRLWGWLGQAWVASSEL